MTRWWKPTSPKELLSHASSLISLWIKNFYGDQDLSIHDESDNGTRSALRTRAQGMRLVSLSCTRSFQVERKSITRTYWIWERIESSFPVQAHTIHPRASSYSMIFSIRIFLSCLCDRSNNFYENYFSYKSQILLWCLKALWCFLLIIVHSLWPESNWLFYVVMFKVTNPNARQIRLRWCTYKCVW